MSDIFEIKLCPVFMDSSNSDFLCGFGSTDTKMLPYTLQSSMYAHIDVCVCFNCMHCMGV